MREFPDGIPSFGGGGRELPEEERNFGGVAREFPEGGAGLMASRKQNFAYFALTQ